jgi:hypothetical protein
MVRPSFARRESSWGHPTSASNYINESIPHDATVQNSSDISQPTAKQSLQLQFCTVAVTVIQHCGSSCTSCPAIGGQLPIAKSPNYTEPGGHGGRHHSSGRKPNPGASDTSPTESRALSIRNGHHSPHTRRTPTPNPFTTQSRKRETESTTPIQSCTRNVRSPLSTVPQFATANSAQYHAADTRRDDRGHRQRHPGNLRVQETAERTRASVPDRSAGDPDCGLEVCCADDRQASIRKSLLTVECRFRVPIRFGNWGTSWGLVCGFA